MSPTQTPKALPLTCMDQQNQPPKHHYPARLKIAKAAPSVQLEQSQLTNPEPVTHQFLTDVVNPPSLLKCKERIKTSFIYAGTEETTTYRTTSPNSIRCSITRK